jgi:hypothetical protein
MRRSRLPRGTNPPVLLTLSAVALLAALGPAAAADPPSVPLSSVLDGRLLPLLQDESEGGGEEPFSEEGRGPRSIMHPSQGELEEPQGPEAPPKRIALGVSALSLALPILGTAGAGEEAPTWAAAFGPGIGAGAGGGYRVLPSLEVRADFVFCSFASKPFDVSTASGPQENEFTDYTVFWFAIGPRFYALPDRPTQRWFDLEPRQHYLGFYPFAGFRIGLLFTGAVDWPTPPPAWAYWDSGVNLFFELYGGVEYRILEFVGAFLEAGLPVLGPPAPASLGGSAAGMNEAGSLTALRVSVGLFLVL